MKEINEHLVVGIGSNIGNREDNLRIALSLLVKHFKLVKVSRIYKSEAYDYENQEYFYNQVAELEVFELDPNMIMKILLEIESKMGRVREIEKGPRIIDLDLLFLGMESFKSELVEIPHPRLFERSFVVRPLKELPIFEELKNIYEFKDSFSIDAFVK